MTKQIFLLGDRNTSYMTHRELDAAIGLLPTGVQARWVGTDTRDAARTAEADGIWVVPGSPYNDDASVYAALTSARTSGQPLLGTCAGFQYAVVSLPEMWRASRAQITLKPRQTTARSSSTVSPAVQPQIGTLAGRPLHPVIEAFVAAL